MRRGAVIERCGTALQFWPGAYGSLRRRWRLCLPHGRRHAGTGSTDDDCRIAGFQVASVHSILELLLMGSRSQPRRPNFILTSTGVLQPRMPVPPKPRDDPPEGALRGRDQRAAEG